MKSEQNDYILEMKEITKTFPGVTALDRVDFRLRPGSVHALIGENGAGKSTLMKCLFGIYREDGGEIILEGKPLQISTSKQALDLGISMIHQEPHPIRFRTVMENIWVGRFPMSGIAVSHRKMYERTQQLLEEVELDIDPKVLAGELSASNMQMVEIAKAISYNAKIIIMDEPTSSLTERETQHLFRIIRKLQAHGCAIIYISHKMEEILAIADTITILRDGQLVGEYPAATITISEIINNMVGRSLTNLFPGKNYTPSDEVVLEVQELTASDPRSFRDVSFDLKRGEILGIGGLVGAQRTELVEALFGLRGIASGQIRHRGQPFSAHSPRRAIAERLALLTEERRRTGIFPILSVLDNTVIVDEARKPITTLIHRRSRLQLARAENEKLRTKTPTMDTLVQNLSGGNQQKVLLARWLIADPDILILDEPTRGIDVGAKYEIYLIMHELIEQGKSIIMISSEMPELLGMSDRIMVMCEGRVTGILPASETNQVEIMHLATQYIQKGVKTV